MKIYFQYEEIMYRSVLLTKSDAVQLEHNEKLLKNTYAKLIQKNHKIREFHVDTH